MPRNTHKGIKMSLDEFNSKEDAKVSKTIVKEVKILTPLTPSAVIKREIFSIKDELHSTIQSKKTPKNKNPFKGTKMSLEDALAIFEEPKQVVIMDSKIVTKGCLNISSKCKDEKDENEEKEEI